MYAAAKMRPASRARIGVRAATNVRLDGDKLAPDRAATGIQPDGSLVPFRLACRWRRRHMVEFQPFGPKLPHDPEGTLEHEPDVREEAERARDVKRTSEAKKPWWAFWRRNGKPTG